MGYAMSSKGLENLVNHEIWSIYDPDYVKAYLTTASASQENVLFVKELDFTHIYGVYGLIVGKKAADTGVDNHFIVKADAYALEDVTFTDVNENSGGGWTSTSSYTGNLTLKIYLTGGDDSQRIKYAKVWCAIDKNL